MSTDELAEGVAARVLELLKESERTVSWLARQTGINYKTLTNQLKRNPRTLSNTNAILIARALGVTLGELVPERSAA